MPEKGGYIKLKNNERKTKLPFMIYVDFESIIVPEDNGKQNPDSLIGTNIKSILFAVISITLCVTIMYV